CMAFSRFMRKGYGISGEGGTGRFQGLEACPFWETYPFVSSAVETRERGAGVSRLRSTRTGGVGFPRGGGRSFGRWSVRPEIPDQVRDDDNCRARAGGWSGRAPAALNPPVRARRSGGRSRPLPPPWRG